MLRAVYRASRRLSVIDVTRLMHWQGESLDIASVDSAYQCRSIQQAELRQRIADRSAPALIGDPDAITGGNRACVAAVHNDRIASFLWIASERVDGEENFSRSQHLGTSMDLPHAGGFVFNAWTDPEHRGHGLIAGLLGYVIRHRLLGTQSLWTTMDWTNAASRRAFEKVGMQSMGLIWRIGFGPCQISKLPNVPATLGLRIADDAPGVLLNSSR